MTKGRCRVGDRRLAPDCPPHPDWLALSARAGGWRILGGSAAGLFHRSEDRPRDDAIAGLAAGDWVAVAASDGAGSCPASRYGSTTAVTAVCEALLDAVATSDPPVPTTTQEILSAPPTEAALGDDGSLTLRWQAPAPADAATSPMRAAFATAQHRLRDHAQAAGAAVSAFHCTLLAALLNTATGQLHLGQVGDGAIIGLQDSGTAQPLLEPPSSGQAGVTYFLTQPDWADWYVEATLDVANQDLRTILLMTDGVADDVTYPPPVDVLDRFTTQIDQQLRAAEDDAAAARRLVNWLGTYEKRGSFDDRTLLLLQRDASDETPPAEEGSSQVTWNKRLQQFMQLWSKPEGDG